MNISRRLGVGTFGSSYVGVLRERHVTIKKLNVDINVDPSIAEAYKEEALILRYRTNSLTYTQPHSLALTIALYHNTTHSAVKHGNLVEFIAVCCDTELCTVQEHINGIPSPPLHPKHTQVHTTYFNQCVVYRTPVIWIY